MGGLDLWCVFFREEIAWVFAQTFGPSPEWGEAPTLFGATLAQWAALLGCG